MKTRFPLNKKAAPVTRKDRKVHLQLVSVLCVDPDFVGRDTTA